MPRTPEQAFSDFHARLIPTRRESRSARRHRASIRLSLRRELGLKSFSQCGSFGNGTSIAGFSDTDYLAWFPASVMSGDSRKVMRQISTVLSRRFPNTGIRVNTPAIKVPFGKLRCETTEVVPGKIVERSKNGKPVYLISDGEGGWMRTSPNAHKAFVADRDEELNGRLKPLICFVKAWKYANKVPISSFYLEMRVTRYMAGKATVDYPRDLAGLFAQLAENLADVRDPVGVSGLIKACSTDAKAKSAHSKLVTAASRSAKALKASRSGKVRDALKWWGLLFGKRFPKYG